jgi:hemoglobin-like flavoprotein
MVVRKKPIALFNDSLERCRQGRDFLDRFYELFLSSSEEVRQKFEHTDFARQKAALALSFYYMVSAIGGDTDAQQALGRIAQVHSRTERDIRPELYDLWLECLLQAVRKSDPKFNQETEQAWQTVMAYGMKFLKARY